MKIFNKLLIALCTMFIGVSTFEGNCSNNNYMNTQNTDNMINNIQNSQFFLQNNQNMNNSMYFFPQNNQSITTVNNSLFAQKTYNMHSTINTTKNTIPIEISVPAYSPAYPKMLISKHEYKRYPIFEQLSNPNFYNQDPYTYIQYIQPLISSLKNLSDDMKDEKISQARANNLCNYMSSAYDIFMTELFHLRTELYWEKLQAEEAKDNDNNTNNKNNIVENLKNSDANKQQIAEQSKTSIESQTINYEELRASFKQLDELYHKFYYDPETKRDYDQEIINNIYNSGFSDNKALSKLWDNLVKLIMAIKEQLSKEK